LRQLPAGKEGGIPISAEQDPFVIGWVSNADYVTTGYGRQTAENVPRIEKTGRRVIVYSYYGLQGASTTYNGHLILPPGQDPYGSDIMAAHCERTNAQALITLMDAWVLDKPQVRDIRERLCVPVLHWMPVDCFPLSEADERHLRESGARPIAMSRYGYQQLLAAGFRDTLYVPHCVDTAVFKPHANREALRRDLRFEGRFVIGIAAANKDQIRKAFPEQFEAFRIFSEKYPEANALLSVHSLIHMPTGLHLQRMAQKKGIADRISFNDQYAMTIGAIQPVALADWLAGLDLLSNTSYGGGFELTPLEALSCGTPVAVNDWTAMTELCGAGWKVRGQKFWNEHHGGDWQVPFISEGRHSILAAYEKAYALWRDNDRDHGMDRLREKARKFALRYDADLVLGRYWKPVLAEIEAMRRSMLRIGADRDAAVARLSAAWSDGRLDAEAFGARARHALSAATADDLIPVVADLPEAA
jgi:glycosyltransferase involved in cell wall biosynthesis